MLHICKHLLLNILAIGEFEEAVIGRLELKEEGNAKEDNIKSKSSKSRAEGTT